MISFCTGYGGSYNPSKIAIQLPSLNTLRTNAITVVEDVNSANTAFINATNARQIAFTPVKPLATRLVNALEATDATDQLIKDAKTLNRKVQGSRKGKGAKPETPPTPPDTATEDKKISVSQQSYDSIIENLGKLGELVVTEPSYTPNEVELQQATLITFHNNLKATNTAVINATTSISNARIARNQVLYAPKTGLYDIAQEVKKYVKSVFGATSPQYKQVSKIKFTKPRK
ncbi:MAG: hypothetical protein WAU21_07365 [Chitinophagales bacterium]